MTKSTLTTLSQSEKDVTELLLFGARELIAQAVVAELQALLEQHWIEEHRNWCQRDLSRSRYVYWWDDGIYSNVRMDGRLCLLVIIGITEHGRKELVAVADGYRESEASWAELLSGLRSRGLTTCPKLAIGDGSLGFRKALGKCYPETRHKTANILSALPKSVQPKVKAALHEIWMAQTRDEAYKAFDRALARFGAKYPGAWRSCVRIERSCWPSTIARQSAGCISGRRTRSNRRLRRYV